MADLREECLRSQRSGERLFWAFLRDPMPTSGPDRLHAQMRVVDAIASAAGRRIGRYVIDSGGARTAAGGSVRLDMLAGEVRADGLRVTLVVADAGWLSSTRKVRSDAILTLLAAGIILKDPSGELHPSETTDRMANVQRRPRRVAKRTPRRAHA